MKKSQIVVIKGTKEGISLHLDDLCSFEELLKELDEKLSESSISADDRSLISVTIKLGNRYLTPKQEEVLKEIIRQKKNLAVGSIVSNVITKEESDRLKAETEIVSVAKVVRSGQVLEVAGDLLLIGDVNPGGTVKAGGNIFIMGALKGIAHAGYNGNDEAIIAASVMKPTQLRINECINRAPDYYPDSEKREMECAYINASDQIMIDRIQVLSQLRPNLTRLEGGR
ncbi:septum site-determining protein MinC [Bacillus massilinigeriensis]|uniref:septum site-determining protein MinC n=1 Tax=Bacillus massilionigeriensis TaxID=1805475 RepID=UPI00096B022F|nr:septum site-determining protein MinC [Bacillus massilionigeriensis]